MTNLKLSNEQSTSLDDDYTEGYRAGYQYALIDAVNVIETIAEDNYDKHIVYVIELIKDHLRNIECDL